MRLCLPLCRLKFDIVVINDRNLRLPRGQPFDYQLAIDRLRDFSAPRDKLRNLCDHGSVVRVKKGLYLRGWEQDEEMPVEPVVLAGLIYGPSYVSLETALAYHGLIPERVVEITCVTSKRAKVFETPVGRFRYVPVKEQVYSVGIRLEQAKGGHWLLAEPEKALCDRIALIRDLTAARDIAEVLAEDLRIDLDEVLKFRLPVVDEIATLYRRKSVTAFQRWLAKAQKKIKTP